MGLNLSSWIFQSIVIAAHLLLMTGEVSGRSLLVLCEQPPGVQAALHLSFQTEMALKKRAYYRVLRNFSEETFAGKRARGPSAPKIFKLVFIQGG
jgi:hypothetical protein